MECCNCTCQWQLRKKYVLVLRTRWSPKCDLWKIISLDSEEVIIFLEIEGAATCNIVTKWGHSQGPVREVTYQMLSLPDLLELIKYFHMGSTFWAKFFYMPNLRMLMFAVLYIINAECLNLSFSIKTSYCLLGIHSGSNYIQCCKCISTVSKPKSKKIIYALHWSLKYTI